MKAQQTTGADSERGARIIQAALQLLKQGKARGWSHAIEQARQQTK
jgi:hypothetical protein